VRRAPLPARRLGSLEGLSRAGFATLNARSGIIRGMSMVIRPVERRDQEVLWDLLHVALWDPPPAGLRPRSVLDNPGVRIYAENWGQPGDVGVIGEGDRSNAVIGACWMRLIKGGVGLGYVDDETPQLGIAVMPAFHRRGYGERLMRSALASAQAHGYRKVSLTVHPENPAIALYERCGFAKAGLRGTYHLMIKDGLA
jgi:ribosomal protein S18 acetylase RimI-like enzyme